MLAKREETFRLQFVIDIIVRNCLGCQSVICDVLVEFQLVAEPPVHAYGPPGRVVHWGSYDNYSLE